MSRIFLIFDLYGMKSLKQSLQIFVNFYEMLSSYCAILISSEFIQNWLLKWKTLSHSSGGVCSLMWHAIS